jgi:hypothetical protein
MISAVFEGITRRHVVIVYRRFGTTYWSHLHGSLIKDLLILLVSLSVFNVKIANVRKLSR